MDRHRVNAVELEKLSFAYKGSMRQALTDCSLSMPAGSLYAVLGPNGAGKTTLLRLLAGKLMAQSGSLRFPSSWLDGHGALDARHYGLLIENPGVYARLTVREYLRFFGGFYGLEGLDQRIEEDCALLGLHALDERLQTLSLGNRQKVQLVRALLHRPSLALLDEPVSNLDPLARAQVWGWLKELTKRNGMTCLVCSHVLGEIEQACSHVAFLKGGSLRASGTLEQVLGDLGETCEVEVSLDSEVPVACLDSLLLLGASSARAEGNKLYYKTASPAALNTPVLRTLLDAGLGVVELYCKRPTLADAYRYHMGEERDAFSPVEP